MKKVQALKSLGFAKSGKSLPFNLILIAAVCLGIFLALCVGKYPVSFSESLKIVFYNILGWQGGWDTMTENVVMGLRLPRVLSAVVIGASLSISGATYQGVFRNPLVSPDFLGVSAGACVGAAIAILLGFHSLAIQAFALAGGILAVALTTLLPRLLRSRSAIVLVLSGVIVGGAMGSIMGLLKYIADPTTQLPAITYWQMGSVANINFRSLAYVLAPMAVSMTVLLGLAWWINILSLGEKDAQALGANVAQLRGVTILCATVLTASSVSISGTIGWVGLVIPHLGRMLVGPDNRRLLPASALLGGLFLLFADTLGRTIAKTELPLSIITGLIGAPFYAWLLYKNHTRLS